MKEPMIHKLTILRDGKEEQVHYLRTHDEFVVGTSSSAHIRISNAEAAPCHCEIYAPTGRFYIKNLDADAETRVNSQKIQSPQPLNSGDFIQIGYVTMVYLKAE